MLKGFGEFCNDTFMVKQCSIHIIISYFQIHIVFSVHCNLIGADQSRIMQEQMSGAAMAMPADTNKAFKVYALGFA